MPQQWIYESVVPGSVQSACQGRFRDPGCLDVVLARGTTLDLMAIGPDGQMRGLVCQQPVFGTVTRIATLKVRACMPPSTDRQVAPGQRQSPA